MVHGLLLARVPRIDVDDLVQDVFLTAMRRLDSLRDPAAFPGWLAAIARNHAIDHLRRNGAAPAELPENLAARESDGNEARAALEAVRSLPEAYRETSSGEHARVAGAGAQGDPLLARNIGQLER